MEATKSSKPLTQWVACGDSASRQAAALWTTTPDSTAWSIRLGGEAWQPSPKSEVYIVATSGKRSLVPVHHTASRRTGDSERPGGRVKTESLLLFPSVRNRIHGLDALAFAARRRSPALLASILSADEVFGTHRSRQSGS